MTKTIQNRRGEGFVDVCVLVLAIVMVLALFVKVMPVFIAKQNLDTYASELVRTAEVAGCVGSATTAKNNSLRKETGLTPSVSWSRYGNIQIGQEVTVTLTYTVNVGLFGGFASFPITLTATATGTSEVYHK